MSFDLLAPHYTWMEIALAGSRLQRCRIAWLPALDGCERILIAGVGHGHFLKTCAQRLPEAEIVSVDASERMLAHAQARVQRTAPNPARLRFVHATLPAWSPPIGRFDAIVTNFFLDCFAPGELDAVVAALAGAARPHAQWLLADFTMPPGRGWARRRARAIHAAMYAFFRPIAGVKARCVTAPDSLLRRHGFALQRRKTSEWGLLHADWWAR